MEISSAGIAPRKRETALDILRIAAIFSAVLIHTFTKQWHTLPVTSYQWQALNFWDSLPRFMIPALIMITGGLFLSDDSHITTKRIFTKYLPRMVCSLFFWAAVYYILERFLSAGTVTLRDVFASVVCVFTFKVHRHLWYLYMMLAVYLCTPIIRRCIRGRKLKSIAIFSVIMLAIGGFVPIIGYFNGMGLMLYMQFFTVLGSYTLGYCFTVFEIRRASLRVIYTLGILATVFTVVGTAFISKKSNLPQEIFYINSSPNVSLMGAAAYAFTKDKLSKLNISDKTTDFITKISELTFGAYLVHEIFIMIIDTGRLGFSASSFNPWIFIPILILRMFLQRKSKQRKRKKH